MKDKLKFEMFTVWLGLYFQAESIQNQDHVKRESKRNLSRRPLPFCTVSNR